MNKIFAKSLSKRLIKPIVIWLMRCGIDSYKLFHLKNIPKFFRDLEYFKKKGGIVTLLHPVLIDFDAQAGSAKGHYFHQDLLVASAIYCHNPQRHIDIGSRIDGFVAHVAAFRPIEVIDVRELSDCGHKNIQFIRANLMNQNLSVGMSDSISCLHAIEHFGLGRYSDPIDPGGHIKGFNNILQMLLPGGRLYISVPIGLANEVHFNAHRVFEPMDIFD
jgi:hypothetical protein